MAPKKSNKSLAVLTSGGDAPGMNAAVRAVVRTALDNGFDVYAIYEGYKGMVAGGDLIKKMDWDSVGGILHKGGTVIGSARCAEFRTREGRLSAAQNLVKRNIDSLVVIGGDGSLTGADLFRQEWSDLLTELVAQQRISQKEADKHTYLKIVGMVGSIDNDMFGTDMTIGADTALRRITDAIDAITSTAASHQRSFVVEVMGRHCGYLALMSGIATGADWVLIPESPPNVDNWEDKMCEVMKEGRRLGRRDSIVIVAEGAHDRHLNPITAEYVKTVLQERMNEDTRVTILGHVQRGGSPSAFDRYMSTMIGHAAVMELMESGPESEPQLIGMRENRITRSPLMECVKQTQAIAEVIGKKDFDTAMDMRGSSFKESFRTLRTLVRAFPHPPKAGQRRLRLAIMNAGGPAAGMNTAARAAIRIGVDKGHIILGIHNGFKGFINDEIEEMGWMSPAGWASMGGAEMGTSRKLPKGRDLYALARAIEEHKIEGLLIIGGWAGYEGAYTMRTERANFPAFNIPIICMPASINNNLPGSEFSIGADTALNNIVEAVDKIKQSAVASQRCFVVEVMGRYCGYLALMSGLATGAERVYMHEEGITLNNLKDDVDYLVKGFSKATRLGLMIRAELANKFYTTDFIGALFNEESDGLFDVRQAILGHMQQGGDPSPYDRIQATRMAVKCLDYLIEQAQTDDPASAFIGLQHGQLRLTDMEEFPRMINEEFQRPKKEWWLDIRPIAEVMAQAGPGLKSRRGD